MKMDEKQILEHIQQLAEERLQKKIDDAFLFPKIPTNTVSTGQAAAPVQYPKATEIAEYEAKIQAEIAAVVEAKKQMAAAQVESERYEYLEIQHHDGTIEYIYADNILLRRAREQEEQRQREAEEQSRREA